MELERFIQIFEETERISRLDSSEDQVLTGLNIIAKYCNKPVINAAEHDIIYSVDVDDIIETITEEDATKLRQLGFGIDSEFDCLYHFV